MNKEYRIQFLAIVPMLAIVLEGVSNTAHGQFPRTFTIGIFRLPQADGSTKFEVSVPGSAATGFIYLPNGESITDPFPPSQQLGHLAFDSFSELKAALVGDWTIEIPMSPGTPHEEYTFEVIDFPESIFLQFHQTSVLPRMARWFPRNSQ